MLFYVVIYKACDVLLLFTFCRLLLLSLFLDLQKKRRKRNNFCQTQNAGKTIQKETCWGFRESGSAIKTGGSCTLQLLQSNTGWKYKRQLITIGGLSLKVLRLAASTIYNSKNLVGINTTHR